MEINEQMDALKTSFSQDSSSTKFFDDLILKLEETKGKLTEVAGTGGGGGGFAGLREELWLFSGPIESMSHAMTNFEIGFRAAAQNIALDARQAFRDQGAAAFK